MRCIKGIPLILWIHSICLSQPNNAWQDQQISGWLQQNVVEIRSIDPSDTVFDDLEPLKSMLQNVRVVMLGEPSHNDGAVFLAKTRLIKFLHQEMNFNVLAFENDFYALAQAWDKIRKGASAATELKENLYWMWGESQQVMPLFEYVELVKDSNPLRVTGFDFRVTGLSNSRQYFLNELDSVISVLVPEFIKTPRLSQI